MAMAALSIWIFAPLIHKKVQYWVMITVAFTILLAGVFASQPLYNFAESFLYRDPIIYSQQTKFQQVVMTQNNNELKMYLDGGIQFNSADEYRYHQALVQPTLFWLHQKFDNQTPLRIAVLGGGDGLAVRDILPLVPDNSSIYLIDIDQKITQLGTTFQPLLELNEEALLHPNVQVVNQDAHQWLLNQTPSSFHALIAGFPDPDSSEVAKLYSHEFYRLAQTRLHSDGVFVTQSSSPLASPNSFWSIHKTLASAFSDYTIQPYTQYVPSFGLWGFNIASRTPVEFATAPAALKKSDIFTQQTLQNLFELSADVLQPKYQFGGRMNYDELKINTLDNLILTQYATVQGIGR